MASVPGLRRRALLSVTDKTDLEHVAQLLVSYDYELVASGGTARYLADHGLPVTEISAVSGFPEILGGRVKTLHPAIHGGILGQDDAAFREVAGLGIAPIDVVIVNLYRFEQTVAAGADTAAIVESIDIGGPALLRSAAKNFRRVTVLPDPVFYEEFLHELRAGDGRPREEFRRRMAGAAFARAAAYNRAIAAWFGGVGDELAGAPLSIPLRYGENPHQKAWLELPHPGAGEGELAAVGLRQWGGKELSYNNLVDLIAALRLVCDFEESCCGIIKHTNPCGFALGEPAAALERALICDPVSAFGGVFAFTAPLDLRTAEVLHGRFLEIVAAPEFGAEALALLRKKKNVRLLTYDRDCFLPATEGRRRAFGRITLIQEEDLGFPEFDDWTVAAGAPPDATTAAALRMTWKVCKHGKSNAIVVGDAQGTLGVGFGQMSRVDSVRIAVSKAAEQGLDLRGAVAASDGFFPFPDGIARLHEAGIVAVAAPGGSIRDEEVAAAAAEMGLCLIFMSRRHFNH
jgi:phosphoribosylaminoimidazolecarboxamide formyltransferase/IMP cyclohydrolase